METGEKTGIDAEVVVVMVVGMAENRD